MRKKKKDSVNATPEKATNDGEPPLSPEGEKTTKKKKKKKDRKEGSTPEKKPAVEEEVPKEEEEEEKVPSEQAQALAEAWSKHEAEIEAKISWLFELYEKHGHMEYAGENVTELQHAQQAAQLARNACQPIHVILGAFFQDIGHLVCIDRHSETMKRHGLAVDGNVTSIGTRNHDKVGAEFLEKLEFPRCVTDLVRGHVNAKRYLVFKHPDYYSTLSRTSRLTLELAQGGPMTQEEAEEFERNDNFHTLLDMRRFNEGAKVQEIQPTDNAFYKDACRKLLLAEKMNLVLID